MRGRVRAAGAVRSNSVKPAEDRREKKVGDRGHLVAGLTPRSSVTTDLLDSVFSLPELPVRVAHANRLRSVGNIPLVAAGMAACLF